jgi:hypothetical protein
LEPGTQDRVRRPEFDAILEKSIEEGLRDVLGESGVQMFLSRYPLNQLSTDHFRFHEAMKDIFLEKGAALIEQEIARRLLDKVGSARDGGTRSRRSRLVASKSNANAYGRASERERKVFREFVALASLPEGHPMQVELDAIRDSAEAPSIEVTSLKFASAFKKGR